MPIDNVIGVSDEVKKSLIKIKDLPSKGDALKIYNSCVKNIAEGLDCGDMTIKFK